MQTHDWPMSTADHWEPPEIITQIEAFNTKWPNAQWGPAHIVLSDYNLDTRFIQFCLERIEVFVQEDYPANTHTEQELAETKAFLLELLELDRRE